MTRVTVQESLPGGCVDGWVTAVKTERTLKAASLSNTIRKPGLRRDHCPAWHEAASNVYTQDPSLATFLRDTQARG